MPRGKTSGNPPKRPIERYEHKGKKRINNPPVGLVTRETEPPLPTHKAYDYVEPVPSVKPGKDLDYDPHLDPQLVWAGKKNTALSTCQPFRFTFTRQLTRARSSRLSANGTATVTSDEAGKPAPFDMLRIAADNLDEVMEHLKRFEAAFDVRRSICSA